MELYIQAFITVLSLMNPVMCGMIFQSAESDRLTPDRIKDASKAALAVLMILMLSALLGERILNVFGISLDVFSVAGGGVLVWMGFGMMRGVTAPKGASSSLTSLVLFAASPGTITGVISIAVQHTRGELPVTALLQLQRPHCLPGWYWPYWRRGSQSPGAGDSCRLPPSLSWA